MDGRSALHILAAFASPRKFLQLRRVFERREYKDGEKITEEGQNSDNLTMLISGSADVAVRGDIVSRLHGGEHTGMIGEISCLDELQGSSSSASANISKSSGMDEGVGDMSHSTSKYTATVVARGSCVTYTVQIDALRAFLNTDAEMLLAVTNSLATAVVGKLSKNNQAIHLSNYEEILQTVLANDHIDPAEKRAVRSYQRRHNVTKEEHALVLSRLGWTTEEYSDGAKHKALSIGRGVRSVEKRLVGLGKLLHILPDRDQERDHGEESAAAAAVAK